MRKKSLALVMALVLVMGMVPLAAYAGEVSCDHSSLSWESDTANHWKTCPTCGKIEEAAHDTSGQDGACSVCKYQAASASNCDHDALACGETCPACKAYTKEHTYGVTGWNENQHYDSCSVCHQVYNSGNHDFSGVDGKCTGCLYGCSHQTSVEWIGNKEGHCLSCLNCFHTGTTEPHVDNDGNGVCDVCNEPVSCLDGSHNYVNCVCTKCGDAYHASLGYPLCDGTYHWWHCGDCGLDVYKDYHWPDENGACFCGYGCSHVTTEWIPYGQSGHGKVCSTCGASVIDYEEHTIADGICTVCGYKAATSQCDHATVKCEEKCPYCDYIGEHSGESGSDSTHHWFKCDLCDFEDKQAHFGMDDGVCDGCFYGCSHVDSKWEYYGQYGHGKVCSTCGAVTDEAEHTIVNGVCTVCGYTPCTGDHTYNRDAQGWAKHDCILCGYIEDCTWGEGCKCTICGEEAHDINWDAPEMDATQHWWVCAKCSNAVYVTEHYDGNNNGLCDVCGYAVSGGTTGGSSSAKDPNLDDVPKTGDLGAVFLAGAALLFGGSGAAVIKRKYRA